MGGDGAGVGEVVMEELRAGRTDNIARRHCGYCHDADQAESATMGGAMGGMSR